MILGKYEASSDEAEGGLARVIRAFDVQGNRDVAVKFIEPLADDLVTRHLWELEYRILKKLNHVNISRLIDAGFDHESQKYVIVLEHLKSSLGDRLNANWTVSTYKEWRELAKSVMTAVKYLHDKGIFHRDIKPDNLMFRTNLPSDTTVVLIDFNISKNTDQPQQGNLTMRDYHTPVYSPKDLETVTDHYRDVWAIVVVLMQVVTPVKIETHRQLRQIADDLMTSKVIPQAIAKVLGQALFPDASQRIETLRDLQDALSRGEADYIQKEGLNRGVVTLRLTRDAISDLDLGVDDDKVIIRNIQRSLESEAYLYRSKVVGGFDQSKFWIICPGYKFKCAVDENSLGRGFIVRGARTQTFDEFDFARSFALKMPNYVDPRVCANNETLESNPQAVQTVVAELNSKFPRVQDGIDFDGRLEVWNRILELREKFLLTRFGAVEYSGLQAFGERVRVVLPADLYSEQLEAMVGSYWESESVKGGYLQFEGIFNGEASFLRSSSRASSLPTEGSLVPSLGTDRASLQRQRTALAQIADGLSANPEMGTYLNDPSAVPRFDPHIPVDWFEESLDQNKRDAVSDCLSAEGLYLVEGPPGTGKTFFIAELIKQQLRLMPTSRILLVSQTHIAVDNALERLEKSGTDSLLRIGRENNPKISIRHLFVKERMRLLSTRAHEVSVTFIEKLLENLQVSTSSLEKVRALSKAKESFETKRQDLGLEEESLVGFVARTQGLKSAKLVSPNQQGLSEDIYRDLVAAGYSRKFIDSVDTGWFDLEIDAVRNGNKNFSKAMQVWSTHKDWIQKYSEDKDLERRFISSVEVVAGTCTGFLAEEAVKELEFDLCIIDEASKATSTEALVPISRSQRVVLVGDTKQLPPQDDELMSQSELLRENSIEAEDIRETLFDLLVRKITPSNKTTLTSQYRMVSPIGEMVSDCFYDGALVSKRESDSVASDLGFNETINWLNTHSSEARFEVDADGKSKANRFESEIVTKQLKAMNDSNTSGKVYSVLVAAPYAAQVSLIRKSIAKLPIPNLSVRVETFDAVQGLESDAVILSLTRSNDRRSYGFIGADYWRRANVAVSRARSLIILVGDLEFAGHSRSSFRKVVQHIQNNPHLASVTGAV